MTSLRKKGKQGSRANARFVFQKYKYAFCPLLTNWQILCPILGKSHLICSQQNINLMAALPEIYSLFAGLFVTGLFYLQYKRYQAQAKKDEMLDSFLKN